MKIKYTFATGETTEVEVNEEIGTVIMDSRRAEHAQDEKKRYHCYSTDAIEFEGLEYADETTPETTYIKNELIKTLLDGIEDLTPIQKRRLMLYAKGLSYRKIAAIEGVDHKKVMKSIEGARKKLKNLY